MNTRIYVKIPNGKKSLIELGALRGLHYVGISKRVQGTRHTGLHQLSSYTTHTHPPTFYKLNARALLKGERKTLLKHSISLKTKQAEHSSFGCLLHNKEHAYLYA